MSRPQGEPCYGAACDCRRCQNLNITLATASGTRGETRRLRFISRLHSMEIVLVVFLVLLGIRVIHLHRQAPEFSFPYLQSKESIIACPSESPPTPRQSIYDGVVSMTRSPRSLLSVNEEDPPPSGYQSLWVILPKVNLESGMAPTPHPLRPTRGSISGYRPPFAYKTPRETYPRRPVGK